MLARPSEGKSSHLFDARPPQGAFIVIESENAERDFARAQAKKLPIAHALKDQSWGHRSFCVTEPNGIVLYFFEAISMSMR